MKATAKRPRLPRKNDRNRPAQVAKDAIAVSDHAVGAPPRRAFQKRGIERVDTILDAAAALIAEQGLGGLAVHSIAKRAHTSIGSMYHFFPDLDAIIAGLGERHMQATKDMAEAIGMAGKAGWKRMSAYEIADAIATPMIEYYAANPHVELLRASPIIGAQLLAMEERAELSGFQLIDAVLASHNPSLSPIRRRARSALIFGAMGGMMAFLSRAQARHVNRTVVIREFKESLAAHLDAP